MSDSAYSERRKWTVEKMDSIRDDLASRIAVGDEMVVLACGSYARREASADSDLDFFVVSDGDTDDLKKARKTLVDQVREVLNDQGISEPADGGAFGDHTSYDEILTPIGGNDDSNRRITRRMLLLLEGDWLVNCGGLREIRRKILERYIQETMTDHQLALFLLNDVIRFWRTMAVDYEFKTTEAEKPWAIRNIKLMFSRKLLYSSGLFSVALTADQRREEKVKILEKLFNRPVVDRMIKICGGTEMEGVLRSYDVFLKAMSDANTRAHLESLRKGEREDEIFRDLKNEGHLLTRKLLRLFENRFDSTHPIRRAVLY